MTERSTSSDRLAAHVRATLQWYRQAGVDEASQAEPLSWAELSSNPVRYLRKTEPALQPVAEKKQPPASTQPNLTVAASDAMVEARKLAKAAMGLSDIRNALEGFDGCRLKMTATKMCFYRGADTARTMVIGEAPGAEEDRAGVPFVGRAGQLFDKMLTAIGVTETDVHITNTVYWRPPGNRTPSTQETQICWPFLERQIELVDPDFLLLLGGSATKTILTTPNGIMKMRGRWNSATFAGRERRVLPTLHPAYLLRTPAAKRLTWRDLLMLEEALTS